MNNFITNFWQKRSTQLYELDDLMGIPLNNQDSFLLTEIGLPNFSTSYFSFFPQTCLEVIALNNERFLILGSPFKRVITSKDNLMVFRLVDGKIFFMSHSFFKIGLNPDIFLPVNKNLEDFLFFNMKLLNFVEDVFLGESRISFAESKTKLVSVIKELESKDKFNLGWDSEYPFYWKKKLLELINEIEERYDRFLHVEDLQLE